MLLRTIVKYCENIEDFINTHGSDEESFSEDLVFQYGCAFSLIPMGQCVKDISPELKEKYPGTDWKGPAGFRDKMAHGYASINISRFRHTTESCSAAYERLQTHPG
jgi:uncharacterized protein with HEPN domain